jgi:hypothetical protein
VVRVFLYVILALYVVRAVLLPGKDIALILGGLYLILVSLVMKKSMIAKGFLFLFGSICIIDFLIYGVQAPWLILFSAGLLLSYESIEFSIRHDIEVQDEHLHTALMRTHGRYLFTMVVSVVFLSLGALWFFERVTVYFSENLYVNILLFSAVFFGVLYLLKYTSR